MTSPHPLRLYNTLTRTVEPFTPADPAHVRIYCCGPTPYDEAHIGHVRSAMLADLLVRHLRARGAEVTYVRNVTDVDDKILRRAREEGDEPLALSARYAAMYQRDVALVGCLPPTHEPRVSECIGDIIEFVRGLVERGAAYEAAGPAGRDVWYSVRSFEGYGKLSRRSLDDLRSGEGLEARGKSAHRDKRDPLDFALWKAAPEGEWAFDSPWGRGRPGWHIECSAMCERFLGFGFDVHLGGMDLIFPHHENEIAQSEAMHPGAGPFARVWMHGGFVNVRRDKPAFAAAAPAAPAAGAAEGAAEGPELEKMSKSLGNFFTVRQCTARNDPEALRYFLLSAHYRVPVLFDIAPAPSGGGVCFPGVDEAERRVDTLYATAERLAALAAGAPPAGAAGAAPAHRDLAPFAEAVRGARGRVAAALDDDLNAPAALAALSELARAAGQLCELAQKRRKDAALQAVAAALAGEALGQLGACAEALGLMRATPAEYAARTRERRLGARGLDAAAIDAQVLERERARQAKDFARADALRAELAARGVELADGTAGTSWRVTV
jgi:cysteinyl-tRNA synthetase